MRLTNPCPLLFIWVYSKMGSLRMSKCWIYDSMSSPLQSFLRLDRHSSELGVLETGKTAEKTRLRQNFGVLPDKQFTPSSMINPNGKGNEFLWKRPRAIAAPLSIYHSISEVWMVLSSLTLSISGLVALLWPRREPRMMASMASFWNWNHEIKDWPQSQAEKLANDRRFYFWKWRGAVGYPCIGWNVGILSVILLLCDRVIRFKITAECWVFETEWRMGLVRVELSRSESDQRDRKGDRFFFFPSFSKEKEELHLNSRNWPPSENPISNFRNWPYLPSIHFGFDLNCDSKSERFENNLNSPFDLCIQRIVCSSRSFCTKMTWDWAPLASNPFHCFVNWWSRQQ